MSEEPCKIDDNLPANESTPCVSMVLIIIPLAPLPLKGLISAVGIPSINLVSVPRAANRLLKPSNTKSKVPLVRSKLMAINIPTKYGIILIATSKPPFAPSTNASKISILL